MKKTLAIIAIALVLILATALSGCTTPSTVTATATPPAGGEVTIAPTAGSSPVTGATGAPKVTVEGDNVKIAGSQGGNLTVNLKKGGYIMDYKFKGDFDMKVNSFIGAMRIVPGGQYPGADGWTAFTTVQKFTNDDATEFIIEATEPYEVNFKRLPLSTSADVVPKTYTGTGEKVVGPLTLKAGSVSFKISVPDLNQAGFSVKLIDATTGDSVGIITPSRAEMESNKLDMTITKTLDADGNYLMDVGANGATAWTIDVSQ